MGGGAAVIAWLVLVVVVVVLAVAVGVLYRLLEVRRAGTPVLLRPIPAPEDRGWRHGSVHYGENSLVYYRLVTFWWGPTVRLIRSSISVVGQRQPRGTEREILDGLVIVELAPGADDGGRGNELGLTRDALTAFQSWLESAPPERARRAER